MQLQEKCGWLEQILNRETPMTVDQMTIVIAYSAMSMSMVELSLKRLAEGGAGVLPPHFTIGMQYVVDSLLIRTYAHMHICACNGSYAPSRVLVLTQVSG